MIGITLTIETISRNMINQMLLLFSVQFRGIFAGLYQRAL